MKRLKRRSIVRRPRKRKTNTFHIIGIVGLVLVSIMAVYIFFVEKNGIDYRAQAAVQQYSFNPTADTHVRSDNPNANFGANVALEVDGSPLKVVYLKFDLSSLLGKTLQAAKLRFYVVDSTSGQIAIKQVENTSWDELSMTYTTRATPGSPITIGLIERK